MEVTLGRYQKYAICALTSYSYYFVHLSKPPIQGHLAKQRPLAKLKGLHHFRGYVQFTIPLFKKAQEMEKIETE